MSQKIYLGSSATFYLEVYDEHGNKIDVDTSRLTLTLIRPDGKRYVFTSGFIKQQDLSVKIMVPIPKNAPTGKWRAIWEYVDEGDYPWKSVTTFNVLSPLRD